MCVHAVVPPWILRKSTTIIATAGFVRGAGSKDGGIPDNLGSNPGSATHSLTHSLTHSPQPLVRLSFLTCKMEIAQVVTSRGEVRGQREKASSGLVLSA